MERSAHWIPENRQERMPARMVFFDTESNEDRRDDFAIQSWRTGSAIRWRNDLKSGDHREGRAFSDPYSLWQWISDYCRKGHRTVVWAHNLGYDVRIAQVFKILPDLGFELEWCNLDRNVSSMTWRSDRGTLVFADTWTWIPLPLNVIAPMTGLVKFQMPAPSASMESWNDYCMRDTEIGYRVVTQLIDFIRRERLGNWQPTGAGMSYATWRHRFLNHQVLVHDDPDAIQAERAAMHTGRAEAWRHGKLGISTWTEVDMRNAYLVIGAECELPRKLRSHYGRITSKQYSRLAGNYRVLCRVRVDTRIPVAPCKVGGRILWPVGHFETWLWDTEIDCALRYGADIRIEECYVYARDPILRDWAEWVIRVLRDETYTQNTIAQTWIKHCSRALIGRLALRVPSWEVFGANPEGVTGITHSVNPDTGVTQRMMHVGNRTLRETAVAEGRDSLPQVTGWVMAECRVRLWEAMNAAGLDHIAHVDTDSLLVDMAGLRNLRSHYGASYATYWQEKGSWRNLEVWGPRCYFRDGRRVAAGVPVKAEAVTQDTYRGERWTALSGDLEAAEGLVVTTRTAEWTLKREDPRRRTGTSGGTSTQAYTVAGSSSSIESDTPMSGAGE